MAKLKEIKVAIPKEVSAVRRQRVLVKLTGYGYEPVFSEGQIIFKIPAKHSSDTICQIGMLIGLTLMKQVN